MHKAAAEQLPQLAAQFPERQRNHAQLEAKVGRLCDVLQQSRDSATQGPSGDPIGGYKDGPGDGGLSPSFAAAMRARDRQQGGMLDMRPPGIGRRPQTFSMPGGQQTGGRPTMDPWQQWLHNLRSGNVHTNNNNNNNNSGPAHQQANSHNLGEINLKTLNNKSVFSEKVAMAPENSYDGERKDAQWRLNVRPYLISRAPSIAHVLQYVKEHEDQSALIEDLAPHVSVPKSMFM